MRYCAQRHPAHYPREGHPRADIMFPVSACLHCGAGLLPVMAAFACAAGPFDDAVKAGEQMPRLHSLLVSQRGVGTQLELGALPARAFDARPSRRANELQHRQHASAVGDPHRGERRQHVDLRRESSGGSIGDHFAQRRGDSPRTPLNAPETLNCFPFGPFRTPSGCGIADPGRRRWAATMDFARRG